MITIETRHFSKWESDCKKNQGKRKRQQLANICPEIGSVLTHRKGNKQPESQMEPRKTRRQNLSPPATPLPVEAAEGTRGSHKLGCGAEAVRSSKSDARDVFPRPSREISPNTGSFSGESEGRKQHPQKGGSLSKEMLCEKRNKDEKHEHSGSGFPGSMGE